MDVGLRRTPMDPARYRIWYRAGIGALVLGIPATIAATALTVAGTGGTPGTAALWYVVLVCALVFIAASAMKATRWAPDPDEIAALAASGGAGQREMVARWRGTSDDVLAQLADDRDPVVADAARTAIRRRGPRG
jgi:hypothetical protein